jgi:hypothetical protein
VGGIFTDVFATRYQNAFLFSRVALESLKLRTCTTRRDKSDDQTAKPITTTRNILGLKGKGILAK